jgi:hypothetical protein
VTVVQYKVVIFHDDESLNPFYFPAPERIGVP